MRISNFLDKNGKVKCWPARKTGRLCVLEHLAAFFHTGRFYTEREVNHIIMENHSFGDHVLLRREMVDSGFLLRTANGSRYWLVEPTDSQNAVNQPFNVTPS